MGTEELSPHPMSSMSHATEKVQTTPTSESPYLAIPAGQSGSHLGTTPVSPHDDNILFLLDSHLRIQAAYCDDTWFDTWEGQSSAPTEGGLRGPGARVIDLTEEYPITQRLADTALRFPSSSEYSLSDFVEINSQAPTSQFTTPHATLSATHPHSPTARPTSPITRPGNPAVPSQADDQPQTALADNAGASVTATREPDGSTAAGKLPAGPTWTRAECRHDACIAAGYTRTPRGSYCRDAMTTITPLSHTGTSKAKKEWKKRTKVGVQRYYCGHCRTDGTDHPYDTCPLWLMCIFCTKMGHLSYACPDPHRSCNVVSCCVPSDQPNIRDFCPTLRVRRLTAWGQCVEEPGEQDMGESFFEGVDWDSFHVD
jgi:hypothetical protein